MENVSLKNQVILFVTVMVIVKLVLTLTHAMFLVQYKINALTLVVGSDTSITVVVVYKLSHSIYIVIRIVLSV